MARLDDRLAALATMAPARMREEWAQAYGGAAPALPSDLLRLGIAYRLQEKKHGGLPKSIEARLLARDGRTPVPARSPELRLGTQLVREWNGRTIVVTVVEGGLLFEGGTHASLSGIARLVTGAHWSGPRFFGIKTHA